jgi:hypothetical protein
VIWQRFGRAARNLSLTGRAFFLVESKYFDETKRAREEVADQRKQKAADREANDERPAKRVRTTNEPCDEPAQVSREGELGAAAYTASAIQLTPASGTPLVEGVRE